MRVFAAPLQLTEDFLTVGKVENRLTSKNLHEIDIASEETPMKRMLVLVAFTLIGSPVASQQASCPNTHYPCGNGGCCSR